MVAATITVLFYHTGFPQYQMVTFVLGSYWAVRRWDQIRGRTWKIVGIACYFGWLAAFDVYYIFAEDGWRALYWGFVENVVGLPSFLIGLAFLASVVWSKDDEPL